MSLTIPVAKANAFRFQGDLFCAATAPDMVSNRWFKPSYSSSELRNGQSFPSEFYPKIIPSIVALLHPISPTAILWRIICVVIPAFNCHSRWALAHIGHKVSKVSPPRTDSYSTCSIILKGMIGWVLAAISHCGPDSISSRHFLRASFSSSLTVLPRQISADFFQPTSAALRHSTSQCLGQNRLLCAARADAMVSNFPATMFISLTHHPSAESLSLQIYHSENIV